MTEIAPPSAAALRWVARTMSPGAVATSFRRLTGGVTSAVHVVDVLDSHGHHRRCVLRRWVDDHADDGPDRVRHEARILEDLERTDVPAPRVLGVDPDGVECGNSALLMTHLEGHVELTPRDLGNWLEQMTSMLVRIHDTALDAPAAESWLDREHLEVPQWSTRPELWRAAIELIQQPPPPFTPRFIHHDYQQFNLLWRRGKITGVVDWVWGSSGCADIDVAHARLNLSVLYSSELAQEFLARYESLSGSTVEPWWDVEGLLHYLPGWGEFLQLQAGRRWKVDFRGMHERVEETLRAALMRN